MHPAQLNEPLILASASPRRRELLTGMGLRFEVRAATLAEPERKPAGVGPRAWATAVAHFKARAAAELAPGRWVLGADTIVVCGAELLNKPRDADDARRMLYLQAGRITEVFSGVALVRRGPAAQRYAGAAMTRVWMRAAPAAIEAYVESGDWAGKAGAYGLQDVGDRLIERIEGSFSNVVGLPVELLGRLLRRAWGGCA